MTASIVGLNSIIVVLLPFIVVGLVARWAVRSSRARARAIATRHALEATCDDCAHVACDCPEGWPDEGPVQGW